MITSPLLAGPCERARPLRRSASARRQTAGCQRGRARLLFPSRGDPHQDVGDDQCRSPSHQCVMWKDAPTHCHQVVQFLRQCPDTVSLELYRDASRSQTPLSPEQVGLAWSFSEFAKENFLCECTAFWYKKTPIFNTGIAWLKSLIYSRFKSQKSRVKC